MERKRVLIDTFHLHHATTGLRTYTLSLCKGLEEYNDSLANDYFFAPNWHKTSESTFFHGRITTMKKILHHLSYFIWKQLILPLKAIQIKADVVVLTDFVAPVWKPGFHAYVVFHDVFFWELKSHYQPLWRRYYTAMAELGIRNRAMIVATSEYTRTKIAKYINPKVPVELIYQTYKKKEKSNLEDSDFLMQFELEPKQYFLHVGYFDKRKNIPLLIAAFAQFLDRSNKKNIRLVLAGGRAASDQLDDFSRIMSKIDELDLRNKIVMTDFLSEAHLQEAYRNAIALVFPSYDEGFGIPVLEAFAHSIPVIVSNRGATSEIGGDAVLVCQWDSIEHFSTNMISLFNQNEGFELVEMGKKRLKDFSLSTFVFKWDKLLSDGKV